MKRTGSIASRVPPAVTTTWRPARSASRAGATSGGRAAGSGGTDRAIGDGRDDRVDDRRRARPAARRPDWPDASGPAVRLDDRVAEASRSRATLATVAGWVHMSPSIAGATTTGADVARQVAVTTSPARPLAIAPSQCAVAGATTIASAAVGRPTMCPIRPSGSRSSTSVSTGWRDSAANDSGPTKRVADGVSMTDDVGALGAQEAQQLDGLVGRDRAGDAEPDQAGPSSRSRSSRRPSSSGSPPPTSAWRMARPLSVRSGSMASMPSSVAAHGAADRPPVRIARTSAGATPFASASSRRIRAEQAGRRAPGSRGPCPTAWPLTVSRPIARSGARSSTRGSLAVRAASASSPSSRPGRDRAADVRAVGRDAVERRRGPEVDDDRRRPVQPGGGQRVDQPVGPDLARPVDPDRDAARSRRWPTRSGRSRRAAIASTAAGQRRHDRGERDRVEVGQARCRRAGAGRRAASSTSSAVARGSVAARRVREQRAGPEQADRDVRVADVEREQHGEDDTRPSAGPRAGGRFGSSRSRVRYHRRRPSPSAHRGDAGCRARPPPSSSSTRAS